MPYGVKEGIDFNRVYGDLIKPALESAGFAVFRADEDMRAGNIRTDMFQELLLADLVVADLSIDNPNVWYELGVRHALRARGAILIRCRRDHMPFDVYTDRSVVYHVKDGVPDPEFIEAGKRALAKFATETLAAWYDRKVSPVYHLLRYLKEPDWKSLKVQEAKQYWEEYETWADRIEIARRGNRPGDILTLADEAPTRVLRIEAYQTAARALLSLEQFALALNQYEKVLTLDPKDLESQRQKGMLLGRLKKHDAAKEWVGDLVKEYPEDPASWTLLGRVEKDSWLAAWSAEDKTVKEQRRDASAEIAILQEAIEAYSTGFRQDPVHFYSGINAVALMHLYAHLTGDSEGTEKRKLMEGGIRWAVESTLSRDPKDYWARATLGELELLAGDGKAAAEAYKKAAAVVDKDWFKLNSSREQLLLFKKLGFRSVEGDKALRVLDRALERLLPHEKRLTPRQVFVFSGHMIDAADRAEPRFPAEKAGIAAAALAAELDKFGAGPGDLALCGGACGGDLLFAEACLARGLRLELRIPFDEPTFLQKSVVYAPGNWTERFYKVKADPKTELLVMPDELGPVPKNSNPYARNNLWQMYNALCWGPDRVRFLCLWNRKQGDAFGGTQHMHEIVQKHSGRVYIIDTTKLW
jgi:tetratricopeptide (TPR) repeat protein